MPTAFELYNTHIAVKNHFTTPSYDFFRYNGKVNISFESFNERKEKFFYERLSKKDFIKSDSIGYFVGNFIEDSNNKFIESLLSSEAEGNYYRWKKRQESITYLFSEDIKNIKDLDRDLKVVNSDYPRFLTLLLHHKITPETFTIINTFVNFIPYWDKEIGDKIYWPSISKIIKKYNTFLVYDSKRFKQILRDYLQENTKDG